MGLDLASFDGALKELYTEQRMNNLTYARNPFFALVPKFEKFFGDVMPVPVVYGTPQGRSATFADAQTGGVAGQGKYAKFSLTRVSDYQVVQLTNEVIEASEGNSGAFMSARKAEIDGAIRALTRSAAVSLYRRGWGAIGRVHNSSFGVTTLTLGDGTNQDPEAVTNFERDMVVRVAAAEDSGALRAGSLTVQSVNRNTGVVTMTGNLSAGIAAIAQGDFIFIRGDRQDTASPARLKIAGLEDWLPYGGATSTAFFGQDRTLDSRMSGQWLDGSTLPINEALYNLSSLIAREGGAPDYCFMNYANFAALQRLEYSKVQRATVETDAKIAFEGIVINGPNGPITVLPDQNCPARRAYMLQLDTWKLCSLGKVPKIDNGDGMSMLRISNSDGIEIRHKYYANLACEAPAWNGCVQLAS
jgi:hypothetical protein